MTVAQAQDAYDAISAEGRFVTFNKFGSTPDDSEKPWRGTTTARSAPEATASVPVVAVPPSGVVNLGFSTAVVELLKRSEQIFIAAPGPDSTDKLEEFDEVTDDDDSTWKINVAQYLRHDSGPRILYYVGVSR